MEVGSSALCTEKELTYLFVNDVVGEVAALTPAPYLHVGGDEAFKVKPADYIRFIERVQAIVRFHGKQMIGWEEIAQVRLHPTTIVQHWRSDLAQAAVEQGAKVILSPASRVYLDMKYDESSQMGLHWAGYVEVDTAYDWDPATQISGVSEADILGVEAPLWSETVKTMNDVEFMVFPRLAGIAEIGWSPETHREWDEYRTRLATHGPRLAAMGVNFCPSPLVPWP
jgi:hexosaminidase